MSLKPSLHRSPQRTRWSLWTTAEKPQGPLCFLGVISYLHQVILSGGWEAPGLAISRRKILLLGTYEHSGGWRQILASFPNGGTASPHGACPGGRTGISLLSPQSPPPTPHPDCCSQDPQFSAKCIQPEGAAASWVLPGETTPPTQIPFALQILTTILHGIRELLCSQSFSLCFILQRIFSQQRAEVEARGG